jgi:hypothetical protein
MFQSEIKGSHSGADDDLCVLGCDTILIGKYLLSFQGSLFSLLSPDGSLFQNTSNVLPFITALCVGQVA